MGEGSDRLGGDEPVIMRIPLISHYFSAFRYLLVGVDIIIWIASVVRIVRIVRMVVMVVMVWIVRIIVVVRVIGVATLIINTVQHDHRLV